jgi:hypothetical protein
MRKFAGIVAVVAALTVMPTVAGAAPIGTNVCSEVEGCDLFADFDDGLSALGSSDGNLGGYLTAYTYLLNASADLSDGLSASEVAHILVVQADVFQLYSNIATLLFSFNDIFNDAVASAATSQQVLGTPEPSGVLDFEGVGYAANGDLVTLFPNFDFGQDTLRIHTALAQEVEPPPTAPVPEPGTMSLLALGGAAAAAVRRRRAAKEAKALTSSN